MSPDSTEQVAHDGMLGVWQGDFSLVADDYVDHNLPPGLPPGRDGLDTLYNLTLGGFPDFAVTIEQIVTEGNMAALRVTNRGTNTGSFMGNPPTGKSVTWTTMAIFRVEGGKLAERWGLTDALSLFAQLGMRPPGLP